MARRPPPAKVPPAAPSADVSAVPPRDAAVPSPELTPWDMLAFRPLREIAAIADPEERRLAALDRLSSIQKVAANRSRTVGRNQEIVYDPDGNTILKAEEIIQRLLAIDPAPPIAPTAATLEPFERAPLTVVTAKGENHVR
jgi:hypothetical protein